MDLRRLRDVYDARAPTYDRTVGFGERLLLGDLRRAFAAELRGEVLEMAIGSGLNLPYYPPDVRRGVGVDLSRGMLAVARRRAADVLPDRPVAFVQMDAERLAFRDASFDTVAVSLALCTVPDPARALREVARVCRPEGRVVLLEHVRSPVGPVYLLQRVVTPLQERALGCHLTRDTLGTLERLGFRIEADRTRLFAVFHLIVARPPAVGDAVRNGRDRR